MSEEDEPYLVWSVQHNAWWRDNLAGYTKRVLYAGLYSKAEALNISHHGRDGWGVNQLPDEIAVPISSIPKESWPE